MKYVFIGVATFALAGTGWLMYSGTGTPIMGETSSLASIQRLPVDARIPELVGAVQVLAAVMEEQAKQQAQLTKELNELKGSMAVLETTAALPAATIGEIATEDEELLRERFHNRFSEELTPQYERLIDAGFTPTEGNVIIGFIDAAQLQQMELSYEAAREGKLNSASYWDTVRELPSAQELVREEYGEDGYDKYLYATGSPNRLIVRSVLANSVAAEAGLQRGDTFVDFAGERVYSPRDLMTIASKGDAGEVVAVRVLRDGNILEYYVPRGPLGVNTRSGHEKPPDVPQ